MSNKITSYADAGVDIAAGDELVQRIKPYAKKTQTPNALGGLGGFGALFELPWADYSEPVLVSGTDGVGTKLKLAQILNDHSTIGIDLVAMCVNDIITCGAKPLFFLDYFATGKLNVDQAEMVIKGIAEGCLQAGCALSGGETAEMPGMYHHDEYDLAGFTVGIVEKSKLITGETIAAGDQLIGIASSGIHSNGYSLVRKLIDDNRIDLTTELDGKTIAESLLAPTVIYVKLVEKLIAQYQIKGLAHITGGGLTENIPRVLPASLQVNINNDSWEQPAIFKWLQDLSGLSDAQMQRTFNCGIGMVAVVAPEMVDEILTAINQTNKAWHIGQVEAGV